MRLAAIAKEKTREIALVFITEQEVIAGRASHLEVDKMRAGRRPDGLYHCRLMADDERALASFVIDDLAVETDYVPSMSILEFIRSINSKLALAGC